MLALLFDAILHRSYGGEGGESGEFLYDPDIS